MSEQERFLSRWSRRKREVLRRSEQTFTDAPRVAPHAEEPAIAEPCGEKHTAPASEQELDLSKLPSIESIGPGTDIRAFLAPGVPPGLARAALRRVWSADPAIRDYIGLSENAWDFNDPDAMAGFGRLELTDEVRRMISQIIGDAPPSPAAAPDDSGSCAQAPAPPAESAQLPTSDPRAEERRSAQLPGADALPHAREPTDTSSAAMQKDIAAVRDRNPSTAAQRRRHGRALPEER